MSVLLTSSEKLALIRDLDEELPLEEAIETYMTGLDVVITEGYKTGSLPKIEVYRKCVAERPACAGDPTLMAFVSDAPMDTDLPVVDINDYERVADIIEREIIGKKGP